MPTLLETINEIHRDYVKQTVDQWMSVVALARSDENRADQEAIEAVPALEAIEKAAKAARELLRGRIAADMLQNGVTGYQSRHYEADLARSAIKAIVTDEAKLRKQCPEFFERQLPKLKRAELTDALKQGQTIPGATLSNGGEPHIVVRARKDLAR
ncbi:hypothetical protein GOB93_14130 [Acetobacter musti]|uniref:Phage protein n=1 Tax=Acetobacter musti TaxID=864732 RepID=A0ABX0JQM5_9PROT|nr:siphovirus Gp157 family protein [Acetobacter musti]NHN85771.1 hypothetical protein [Acetobacter musti]